MRVKLKKLLCLLCVLTLLVTSTGILPALALDEAGEADAEMANDPNAVGEEKEESGLFVMTGLESPPDEESEQEAASVPGEDAQSVGETLSQPGKIPEPPQLLDGSSVVTPDTTPELNVSATQISKKVGETVSVTVTISGYPSGAYLQASNSNSEAYSCIWGDWNKTSIPIRITGKKAGGGTVTVSLKDSNNKTLVTKTISVTMTVDKPTLSFSPSSLSMKVGESKTSTLKIQNYSSGGSVSASVANSSICAIRWGNWSGWNIPITVTGKSAGSTKVTVKLYNSSKTELASVTLSVVVTASASLSLSASSLSVSAGESAVLTATANGTLSSGDCFKYSTSNSNVATITPSGSVSGQSLRLLVAGKNEGSATLTVTLNSKSGEVLDRKTVSVTVKPKPNNQRVSVSPTSVTVKAGSSVKVNCTGQNVSGAFSMRYVNNSPSLLTCAWKDNWSGNTVPVTITGNSGASGSGSVTIELVVGGVTRSTATIQVKVESNGGGNIGQSPSYSFDNYSKPRISLALCQYMFGKNQKAQTVYNYDVGNGGVCFGMAGTSGLLSSPNAPNPSTFGRTSMTALKKSDYSSSLGLSLSDFIEAMHITQVSTSMQELSGISSMVSAVRSGGTSQPVIICVRGPGGGHAILGYGVDSAGSIIVYDSNWPGQARKVSISGNSWSYELWAGKVWNNYNGRITYIPYSTYSKVWQSRGSLKGAVLMDGGLLNEEDSSRYLLATTADNFSLAVFDDNPDNHYEREIAVYKDGVLVEHDDIVEEVFIGNVPLNSDEPEHLHMLYVPGEDLYTVHNRSGKMDVTLSGNGLSVHVDSEAETFDLAVSDKEEFATAMLNGLEEGEQYSISVGSSRPGDPDTTQIEGTGNGQPICLGIGESMGVGMEGLYISNGSGDGMLSLNAMDDENAGDESSLSLDFALNATKSDTEYPLTAEAGEGGSVFPQDGKSDDSRRSVNSVLQGGNYTYRIRPESGYTLKAVYVNGVEAAYSEAESDQPTYSYYDGAYEYTFRDVQDIGYLFAEFAKNINECQISAEYDNSGDLVVTVTDGDETLLEGTDYEWSVTTEDSKTYLTVQAVAGSDYSGVSMEDFQPQTGKDISECQIKADYDSGNLTVTVTDGDKTLVEGTDYTYSIDTVDEDGVKKTYLTVRAVDGSEYVGVYTAPHDYHTQNDAPALTLNNSNADEITLTVKNVENPVIVAVAYASGGQMLKFFPNAELSEKTADGVPARISLQDAGLTGDYVIKVFLLSDMDAMRALCEPLRVPDAS